MICVYNAHSYNLVQKESTQQILAQTHYITTNTEVKVMIWCNINTFKIKKAVWEIYRTPEKIAMSSEEVPGLQGVRAYFGCGPALRENLSGEMSELKRKLFADTITAVIQAEVYLLPERGYTSLAAYDRYWDDMYAGACRYYSNLERVTSKLMDYAGVDNSLSSLFVRQQHLNINQVDTDKIIVNAALNDFFHEMAVIIEIAAGSLIIERIFAEILRSPDRVCKEAALLVDRLKGKTLKAMTKKELINLLGARQGCTHLIELIYNSINDAYKLI
ncbi:DUF2889 domain-containing protein [Desulfolucanica intricata]|uniref:DUF2889 domain-containing protein n=1 Tax=Desulfolucanica intricata TaxID=1285191 RepID=UPI000829A8AE|nr:DUF2889 domain-containing protein [Desulfolucanica intricata]